MRTPRHNPTSGLFRPKCPGECQTTRLPDDATARRGELTDKGDCQTTRLPDNATAETNATARRRDCQTTRLPDDATARRRDCQTTRLPDDATARTTRLPDDATARATRLPDDRDCQTTRLPDDATDANARGPIPTERMLPAVVVRLLRSLAPAWCRHSRSMAGTACLAVRVVWQSRCRAVAPFGCRAVWRRESRDDYR